MQFFQLGINAIYQITSYCSCSVKVKSVKYRQLSRYILQFYNLKLMECYCTELIFSITYISLLAVIFIYIAV